MADHALGIDIGGTYIKWVVATAGGRMLSRDKVTTDDRQHFEDHSDWLTKVKTIIADTKAHYGTELACALSAPGLCAADNRSVTYMPGRLQWLENLDWSETLGEPVQVLNDGHAALLGEVWLGRAGHYRHLLMFTLGTGIGGALYSNGKLQKGHLGRAGHLGHICQDPFGPTGIVNLPGTLEVNFSNADVHRRSRGSYRSVKQLVADHERGDHYATLLWLNQVHQLACGIASAINITDPEAVIIAGGISAAGDSLFKPLRRYMELVEWRPGGRAVDIVAATLGGYAGAAGAAYAALHPEALATDP